MNPVVPKLQIRKYGGRWHVYMKLAMDQPIGIGWSSFDLARQSAINFLATAKAVHLIGQTNNKKRKNRRTDAVDAGN